MKNKTKLTNWVRPLLLGGLLLNTAAAWAEVQELDRIAAIVNNDVIMKSQLDERVQEAQQMISKREGTAPEASALQKQVLDQLILESIEVQMGEKGGVKIGEDELNQAMGTLAQRQNLTLDQFREALAQQGVPYDQVREQIRRQLVVRSVRDAMVDKKVKVSDQELQNFMNSDFGRLHLSDSYHLANIVIPIRDESSAASVRQAESQAQQVYQQANQGVDFGKLATAHSSDENAFSGGEIGWRKAAELPAPFDHIVPGLSAGQVTEPVRGPGGFVILKVLEKRGADDAVQQDEVHVRHILIRPSKVRTEEETEQLINRLYQRIQSGEDFAALAKSFSEDPGSALNGGDLGWVPPQAMVPAFRQVLEQSPVGELSQPFRSPYGWHILEVLGRRATDKSAEARRAEAMNLLRSHKEQERLQTWLRQIRDEAYVEIKL